MKRHGFEASVEKREITNGLSFYILVDTWTNSEQKRA
jgi:hypothetical protein